MTEAVGVSIRNLRTSAGITLHGLAALAGYTARFQGLIETDQLRPSEAVITRTLTAILTYDPHPQVRPGPRPGTPRKTNPQATATPGDSRPITL